MILNCNLTPFRRSPTCLFGSLGRHLPVTGLIHTLIIIIHREFIEYFVTLVAFMQDTKASIAPPPSTPRPTNIS